MTRDALVQVLAAAPGIQGKDAQFKSQGGHRISFHLGREGRGITVNHVLSVQLSDAFIQLSTEEQGEIFVAYDGIHAVVSKPLKEHAPKRTGFS